MTDTVIFTPIPAGFAGPDDVLRLSIFTTFRLGRMNAVLGDFPEIAAWPSTNVTFTVKVGGHDLGQADASDEVARRDDLFRTVFPATTPVNPTEGADDHSGSRIRTYPAAAIQSAVDRSQIQIAAKRPAGPPAVNEIKSRFGFLTYDDEERRTLALEAIEDAIATTGTASFTTKQLKTSISNITLRAAKRKAKQSRVSEAALVDLIGKDLTKHLTTNAGRAFMLAEACRDTRFVPEPTTTVPELAQLDFHEAFAALNSHPFLLRSFGVVRDVTVPLVSNEEPLSLKGLVDVEVTATFPGSGPGAGSTYRSESFVVKSIIGTEQKVFRAATRSEIAAINNDPKLKSVGAIHNLTHRLHEGYLKLSDKGWKLVTLDVDEAAFEMSRLSSDLINHKAVPATQLDTIGKLKSKIEGGNVINPGTFAAAARADADAISGDQVSLPVEHAPADRQGVAPPSMRSTGISLVRESLEAELKTDLRHMTELERQRAQGKTVYLTAEDITRGYAIDVWDDRSQTWHSLCRREGAYEIGATIVLGEERSGESAVIPALNGLKGGVDDFVMHPSLATWSGWSLAAPLPGKALESAGQGQPLIDAPNEPLPGYPLRATYRAAPRSLPRLRFGWTYRMRARAIDIAGNAIPLEEARDDKTVTIGPITYPRYDVVSPPYLLLRTPKVEAESVERMVYRARERPEGSDLPSADIPERWFLPPRTAWSLAEAHGALDDNVELRHDAYQLYADPNTPGAHKEGAPTIPGWTPPVPGQPADPIPQDPIFTDTSETAFDFSYLPDAGTRKVLLKGVPGEGGATTDLVVDLYPDGAQWPNARIFVIRVVAGTGAPQEIVEDEGSVQRRILEVKVPAGRAYNVRYSSIPHRPELSPLHRDVGLALKPEAATGFKQQLAEGRVHLCSPARDLVLVHAVRVPNTAPDLFAGGWKRQPGDTFVHLRGKIALDRPSTERMHLRATWTEYHDVEPDGPTTESAGAIVAENQVGFVRAPTGFDQSFLDLEKPEVATGVSTPKAVLHEFGDTKHRKVTYTPVGSSRFAEHFPRSFVTRTRWRGSPSRVVLQTDVVETSVVVRKALDVSVVYQRYRDYDVDGPSGVITRLPDSTSPLDDTLNITYQRSTSRDGVGRTMHLGSAARPAAPKVAYITPAFKWEPEAPPSVGASEVVSTRRGRILRVWLDRPWYSSGEDERLGVLLLPSKLDTKQTNTVEPYVTQLAADPLWAAPSPKRYASKGNFPGTSSPDKWGSAVDSAKGVTLAELPTGPKPDLAAYDVDFDPVSKRWFADITMKMNIGAIGRLEGFDPHYMPFVRLALVRYQRYSLGGLDISPVVRADFVQIAPDRMATVVRQGSNLLVTIEGNTYAQGPGNEALMQLQIQHRTNDVVGGAFAYTDTGAPLELRPALNDPGRPTMRSWTGSIPAPAPGVPARLVIREYERFPSIEGRPAQRMVYLDTFPIEEA